MDANEWKQVDAIVVESAVAVFAQFGVDVQVDALRTNSPFAEPVMMAIIGFASDQMRGSLLVGAGKYLLARSHPSSAAGEKLSDDALQDWSGEFANLLLGRIKSRLMGHGITIQLGTPTTLSGIGLKVGSSLCNVLCLPHVFQAEGAIAQVRLDAMAAPGLTLQPLDHNATDVCMEDGLLLF